jgi:amino acid adenylation domain-containing protein
MHPFTPSVSQQLIWLDQALTPHSAKYTIGGYATLNGPLSYDIFQQAICQVLRDQEAYSSIFSDEQGSPLFYVQPAADNYVLEAADLSGNPDPGCAALRWMEDDFARPFEVRGQYLFRFRLLRVGPERHFWYACIHHLIGDGWSFMLLLNQAAAFYTALSEGRACVSTPFRYTDYIAEEQEYYRSELVHNDRHFWLDQFRSAPPFPFTATTFTGDTAGSNTLSITRSLRQQLQASAEEYKVSLFQLIIGALATYLCRICETGRLVIATPVLNRTKKQFRNTAGVFMNLLAIPFEVECQDTFSSLVQQVRQKMSASLRHQRYPYGQLVKDIGLPPTQHQLYGVRVSYESFDFTSNFGELEATAVALSNRAETDPLAIYIREYHDNGFDVRFIYDEAYFTNAQIQSIAAGLHTLLANLPYSMNIPLKQLPVIDPVEEAHIKTLCEGTRRAPGPNSFAHTWRLSVDRNPDAIALSTASVRFSYKEIDERVNGLLKALQGAAYGKPVALVLPRSEVFAVALLACITAGVTYVPIDASTPVERLRFILEDTGADCLVTTRSIGLPALAGNMVIVYADEIAPLAERPPVCEIAHDDACYILYTSGSTGKPKGIVVSHGSVVDYAETFADYFRLTPTDVVLQQASFGFDTSVEEIFPILSRGGRLHIVEDNKDMLSIRSLLFKEGITLLSTSPWVIRFLNRDPLPSSLRILISGGDVLSADHVSNIHGVEIYNTYGPTESTVCATYYRLCEGNESIPIGRPITNREVYILDEHQQLQPFDTEGEICIGGAGLALHYLNNETLTAEKFIGHPFRAGSRLYRSGDRGILRCDGQIFFRGRKDQQLSFRGYRIEAEEVEGIINRLPTIEASMVDVRLCDGEPVLVAYVKISEGSLPQVMDWKSALRKSLQPFMVPGAWVVVPDFSLLPSGKIDRQTLPDPAVNSAGSGIRLKGTQGALQELWQDILHTMAGPDDSFFELGGHSLNIVQLIAAIRTRFPIRLALHQLYEKDTIRMQAGLIDDAAPEMQVIGIQEEEVFEFALTPAQKRLWVLSQLEDASKAYHIAGGLRLRGSVDVSVVVEAVRLLTQRHDSLRTVFVEQEQGGVVQKVLPEIGEVFSFLPAEPSGEWAEDLAARPFDLASGPLFRVTLVKAGANDHILVYVFHHLIADGWSVEILLREFLALCRPDLEEEGRKPIKFSYINYIKDNKYYDLSAARAYWQQRLDGPLPVVELPTQFPRPAFKTYSGRVVRQMLDQAHLAALETFCQQQGVSVFVGLLATLNALLMRYTGLCDTIVGVPIANRPSAGSQSIVGLLLDTAPVRTAFAATASFNNLLQVQKKEVADALMHGHHPLDETLSAIGYRNDPSRSPLFDVLMVLHNQATLAGNSAGLHDATTFLEITEYEVPLKTSQFDMSFAFYYRPNGLELQLQYNDQLFEDWFARQVAGHFASLSWQLLQQPDTPLYAQNYITPAEQVAWNLEGPELHLSDQHLLLQLKERAGQIADAVAVVCADRTLSYGALVAGAGKTSAYLQSVKGVRAGDRVAVLMHASEWLPALIYGLWQAGAVYVPLHPANPELRRQLILEDSDCKVVITEETIPEIQAFQPALQQEDSYFPGAYLLYTSGTTGRPKGVLVGHGGLSAKLAAELTYLPRTTINSCLLTNYGFDVSFLELFLPLLTGGTVAIPGPAELFDPEDLGRLLVAQKINVVHGTPTFIESLFRQQPAHVLHELNHTLRMICMGGESLYASLVEWLRRELPDVQLNNHYGPTEAIIHATVKKDLRGFEKNSIGTPMPGVHCYLFDTHLQPVPKGVPGELYIGGRHALADGYINRREENDRKFIAHPFRPGEKIYHTGDLARLTAANEIEFLGRGDDQIKIRGFRVELDEIQRLLEAHPGVAQAVVCPHQSGQHKLLTAFLVYKDIPLGSLRPYLQLHLPDYMIPAQFVEVDRIPLNGNGKVDRDALLQMAGPGAMQAESIPPRTPLEMELCLLWEELLERRPVGIRDNFFDLGGNSMLLIRMRTQLKRTKGLQLEMRELLRLLTVEEMAEAVESLKWMQESPAEVNKSTKEFYI